MGEGAGKIGGRGPKIGEGGRKSSNYPPWGLIYFLDFCMRAYSKGVVKFFFAAGHIPGKDFLLVNYFFDATHISNTMFIMGRIFVN